MAVTYTPRLNQTRWSSGQDTVKREDFDQDSANIEAEALVFKEGTLSERPAAGVVGRLYTVKNDSVAENNGKQFYDNGVEWKANYYTNNQLAESIAPSNTALTVRGQPAQTVDYFHVQDSTNSNLFRITNDGYTTNQTGTNTAGARLGFQSSHTAAGVFNSVSVSKPSVIVRGAAGQTANPFEVRASSDAPLAFIDRTGGATFSSGVTVPSIAVAGNVAAGTVNVSGAASLFDTTITASTASQTALTINSHDSTQTVNTVELYSAQGKRSFRLLGDGTVATDGRLLVGGEANSGNQVYTTSPVAQIKNILASTATVLSLEANASSQTGKMLQTLDSTGVTKFWVDNTGAFYSAANAALTTAAVGSGAGSPTPYYNGYKPRFEVLTGGATGSYDESVSIRHTGTSSSAVSRRVGLRLKLNTEANKTESDKWAGIYAASTVANSAAVGMELYTGGSVSATIDATGNANFNGNVRINPSQNLTLGTSASNKIFLTDTPETNVIGQQNSGTVFIRSNNFGLYSGGVFNSQALNTGGGTLMASFTPSRTTLQRLTIASVSAYNSSEPMLQLGTVGHMQFSNYSINSYDDAANTVPAEINLCNNGGRLRLGNVSSTVSLPSRKLYVGNIDDAGAANAMLFARSSANTWNGWVGRGQQNGDWWFDHTTNTINVHDGTKWHVFKPDHTSTAVGGD